MRYRITHLTRYDYDRPVFLEPQTIRLQPRSDPFQRLDEFGMEVTPPPSQLAAALDPQGNSIRCAWFEGLTESLTVRVEAAVETLLANPFDYMLTAAGCETLPMRYPPEDETLLNPCLEGPAQADAVADFARSVAEDVELRTMPFLTALTDRLFDRWEVEIRETGDPHPPEQTLREEKVACRDLAVLFMACCRSLGIASRFVSGYQEGDREAGRRDMHAWAEVYLPGGGWRGYDPTHGLAVADRHIAVAAAPTPAGAAPISGSFRGTDATARMQAEVRIDVRDD